MPKLLLIELQKHIPSYFSGPLLVFAVMPMFMSSPLFYESLQNAEFDAHHLHSQLEEVRSAKIASYRACQNIPKQTL